MKVEPAEAPVNVEDLACEEQSPAHARFHRRRVDFAERHTAGGHFRVGKAATASNRQPRLLERSHEGVATFARQVRHREITRDTGRLDPPFRHRIRESRRHDGHDLRPRPALLLSPEPRVECRKRLARAHVETDLAGVSAFMRPVPGYADYRTPVHGLYLCGAATHPGGGVMGACGYNAAREILKDI